MVKISLVAAFFVMLLAPIPFLFGSGAGVTRGTYVAYGDVQNVPTLAALSFSSDSRGRVDAFMSVATANPAGGSPIVAVWFMNGHEDHWIPYNVDLAFRRLSSRKPFIETRFAEGARNVTVQVTQGNTFSIRLRRVSNAGYMARFKTLLQDQERIDATLRESAHPHLAMGEVSI